MRGTELLTDARVTAAFLDGAGPAAAAARRMGREIQGNHCAGTMKRLIFALLLLGLAGAAAGAQQPGTPAATVIAVPPLTSPDSGAKGNEMLAVGWQVTQLIETDLRQTAELMPLKPNRDDYYSYPEVTAPTFSKWRSAGAKALVTGFVQSRSDGRLTVGCYVYDVDKGRELAARASSSAPATGGGRRTNARASPTRRSPARRACSTRGSLMSPKTASATAALGASR